LGWVVLVGVMILVVVEDEKPVSQGLVGLGAAVLSSVRVEEGNELFGVRLARVDLVQFEFIGLASVLGVLAVPGYFAV